MIDICSCLSFQVVFVVESLTQQRQCLQRQVHVWYNEESLLEQQHTCSFPRIRCAFSNLRIPFLYATAGIHLGQFACSPWDLQTRETVQMCYFSCCFVGQGKNNFLTLTSVSNIFCQHPWNGGRLTRHAAGRMKCHTLHSSQLWSIIPKITFGFLKLINDKMF